MAHAKGTHTQFLDLTNGEGGELSQEQQQPLLDDSPTAQQQHHGGSPGERPGDEPPAPEDEELDYEDEDDADDGMNVRLSLEEYGEGGCRMNIDPSTPGKVVEAGREHTGRWTKEEHDAFLSALKLYGKEWKKVAAKVKTRTVVQTRTHAQKYFQKLHKTMEATGMEDIPQVEMGSSHSARKKNRRSSSTTISAAQVISGLSHARESSVSASTAGAVGPSVSFVTAGSSHSSSGGGGLGPPPARHGFSYMKITAPDPTAMIKTFGFPEPSPAATGKRKLAEIAAARMLAGVAGQSSSVALGAADDGPPTPPPAVSTTGVGAGINLKEAPPLPPLASEGGKSALGARKGLSLQIVNPDSLGVSYDRKRSGNSPVTPWDGQLEALVGTKTSDDGAPSVADLSVSGAPGGGSAAPAQSVVEPGPVYNRSPLHAAVCENRLEVVREMLDPAKVGAATPEELRELVCQVDDLGFAPLHSASALLLQPALFAGLDTEAATALEMVSMLLQAGAEPAQPDRRENTPLHWAGRAGDTAVVERLILQGSLDSRNSDGETPLHWALRSGKRSQAVAALLLENGARPNILSKSFKRAIDVAAEGFLDEPNSFASLRASLEAGKKVKKDLNRVQRETKNERRESRANLLIRSAQSRTLVLHHHECLEHHPKSTTDWETPDRITSIMRRVLPHTDATGSTETSGVFPHEITVSQEFERAKLDLLRRVHSTDYLSFVNQLSKDLERQLKETGSSMEEDSTFISPPPVVPFTPLVQRSMIKVDDACVKSGLTSDTSFSAGSLKAARRAAGAVQHAVDCVLVGRNRNAFCVVRPPGHHAGINGLLEGGESCGFCIFNNVAAGALYAISDDRLLCNRCAIVDIDVHHGNGTEEIVRKCHDPSKLFFFSIHLYDNDKKKRNGSQYYYKFYPGTGDEDDLALNIINVPIVPMWKDTSPAPPAAKSHNTRQKARSSQESQEESSETETPRDGSRASDGGSDVGSTSASSPRHASSNFSGRMAYRQAIQSRLLPALRAFNPDLILISAGFDAAKGDVGNARHERGRERLGLDLEPEDYGWTTRKILEIADICCHGRVVSVLEGGYGRTPAAPQVAPSQNNSLDRTIFAECAIRHLQAMIDPYDAEQRFS